MFINKFVRRNLIIYFLPNVFFNTCIPYFAFRTQGAVYLFRGEQCFARFLLPMVLFLPFIITFDLSRKTIDLYKKGKTDLLIPDHLQKTKFLFKMAGINGGISLAVSFLILLLAEFSIPRQYGFSAGFLALLLGVTAGLLTVIFTLHTGARYWRQAGS